MGDTLLIITLIGGVVFGSFCGFIAEEKNRNGKGWFILGFFFSVIALLALIAVPKLEARAQSESATVVIVRKPEQWSVKHTLFFTLIGILLIMLGWMLLVKSGLVPP